MENEILISVVICTYNRANLLRDAILSIVGQDYQNNDYELIVVDNNSSDFTRDTVEEFALQNYHVRYILETNIGLSHARNRGWQEAKGKYVCYIDDDCHAPLHWLSKAVQIIVSNPPDAFGGPSYPFYQSKKPKWFKDEYATTKKKGTSARELSTDEFLEGMNMVFAVNILKTLGGFSPEFGMNGDTIAYGEETHLLRRLRECNLDAFIFYDPEFFIYHAVRPEKMKWSWIIRQRFADGRDYYNLFPGRKKPISAIRLIYRIIKNILFFIFNLLFKVFIRDRKKFPLFQNYYYEHTTLYITTLGQLVEQVKEKVPYARR
jgi:glycosyltransferase involved in cell wall biosynthesis